MNVLNRARSMLRGEFGYAIGVASDSASLALVLVHRNGSQTCVQDRVVFPVEDTAEVEDRLNTWRATLGRGAVPVIAAAADPSRIHISVEPLDDDLLDDDFPESGHSDSFDHSMDFGTSRLIASPRSGERGEAFTPPTATNLVPSYVALSLFDILTTYVLICRHVTPSNETLVVRSATVEYLFIVADGVPQHIEVLHDQSDPGAIPEIDTEALTAIGRGLGTDCPMSNLETVAAAHGVASLADGYDTRNFAEPEMRGRCRQARERTALIYTIRQLVPLTVVVMLLSYGARTWFNFLATSSSADAEVVTRDASVADSLSVEVSAMHRRIDDMNRAMQGRTWIAPSLALLARSIPPEVTLEEASVAGPVPNRIEVAGRAGRHSDVGLFLGALERTQGIESVRLLWLGYRDVNATSRIGTREDEVLTFEAVYVDTKVHQQ